jgi:hypothetical protein
MRGRRARVRRADQLAAVLVLLAVAAPAPLVAQQGGNGSVHTSGWTAGGGDDGAEPFRPTFRLEPLLMSGRDSEGNSLWRSGLKADVVAAANLWLGIAAAHLEVSDPYLLRGADQVTLFAVSRPTRTLRLDADAGVTWMDGAGSSGASIPTGRIRARWNDPEAGVRTELRLHRTPLLATPYLLEAPVVIEDAQARAEVPLWRPVRVRGMARVANLTAHGERNRRTVYGGGLVLPLWEGVEVSGQYHETRHARPSRAGYFAPQRVQDVEFGSGAEVYAGTLAVAVDMGAGVQRVLKHGAEIGPWRRSLRFWSSVALPLHSRLGLQLEVEGSDTQVGEAVLNEKWWCTSAVASLRWTFR